MTWTIFIIYVPSSPGGYTKNFALIVQVVSEKMFENNGHAHVYSPRAGSDNPLGSIGYQKHKSAVNLVI